MKTAYEIAKEETIEKVLEEMRIETQTSIDDKLYEIKQELINKPLPEIESRDDEMWHTNLIGRHDRLIFLRRQTLKIKTFKDMDMEELNKLLIGY